MAEERVQKEACGNPLTSNNRAKSFLERVVRVMPSFCYLAGVGLPLPPERRRRVASEHVGAAAACRPGAT